MKIISWKSDDLSKLGLGTAQFGMNYGISNQSGQITVDEAEKILIEAANSGIEIIDTACGYGDSELVLGRALPKGQGFEVVTKTPHIQEDEIQKKQIDKVLSAFSLSLNRLQRDKVYSLMLHNADDLLKPGADCLVRKLIQLKRQGLIQKLGCSFYNKQQIDKVLARYDIDLIQVPVNLFDQRLLQGNYLDGLVNKGIEIHARSVFLQGLFFASADRLNLFPQSVVKKIVELKTFTQYDHQRTLTTLLHFVSRLSAISTMIVGVSCLAEFQQLLKAYRANMQGAIDFDRFSISDESVVNPNHWVTE